MNNMKTFLTLWPISVSYVSQVSQIFQVEYTTIDSIPKQISHANSRLLLRAIAYTSDSDVSTPWPTITIWFSAPHHRLLLMQILRGHDDCWSNWVPLTLPWEIWLFWTFGKWTSRGELISSNYLKDFTNFYAFSHVPVFTCVLKCFYSQSVWIYPLHLLI